MKNYQNPVIELMMISNEDILTASVLSASANGSDIDAINFGSLWS